MRIPTDTYTLPQLSRLLGVHYRTLHSWVERGLLQPSVQRSSGTGTPNLFDSSDAVTACVLVDLRAAGISLEVMRRAADRLRETDDALSRVAFMLVNSEVNVVFEPEEAGAALAHGGLTLAYNTATALEKVAEAGAAAATAMPGSSRPHGPPVRGGTQIVCAGSQAEPASIAAKSGATSVPASSLVDGTVRVVANRRRADKDI